MKNITWSHNLRLRMYEELVNDLGNNPLHFNSRGKPHKFSKAQWVSYLDDLAIVLGLGSGKGGALSNQIAWVFCTPSTKCHKGHWNNMVKNVTAASEAGWLIKGSAVPKPKPKPVTNIPLVTPKVSNTGKLVKIAAIVGTGVALAMGIPLLL